MGTGYTRNDTANNIADGNVINASDLDGEFDAVQAAFNASTGHSHDGTTGEGPQIGTGGIADNAVTLGTKTSGNYVATIATSAGLDGSASSEGATPTISLNLNELTTSTTDGDGDYFVVVDTAGTQRKLTKGNIAVSGFNTANGIALGTDTTGNYIATGAVSGVGLSGSASAEGATFTVTSNATDANTASTIVARDASGNFSAGNVTVGNLITAGNVDGRDVSVDGAKLDGIEAGATADQTASEILTLIKTVDGAGSGLDADTLDGVSSASFLRSDAADTKTSGDLSFSDNVKAVFGAGSDLEIYHDGTHSYIADVGTGNFKITGGSDIQLLSTTGESYITCNENDSVDLFFNDSKKLATTSGGIDVTGTITFDGGTTSADLNFGDNDKAVFGAGSDLQIYHDGSHSYVKDAGTGNLYIEGTNLRLGYANGEFAMIAGENGSVEILHDNATKLATNSGGVTVTGTVTADGVSLGDNESAYFGAGNDLQIYHDGSNNFIKDNGTATNYIQTNNSWRFTDVGNNETHMVINDNGAVNLYYDNGTKIATSAIGVTVTGSVTASDYFGLNAANYMEFSNNSYARFVINGGERARVESDGDFHADGDVIAYSTTISDKRLKEGIYGIEGALDKVNQLNGYTFTYKADGKVSAGVIAQEVENVLPQAVSEKELPLKVNDGQKYKVVNYDALHALLIEAIKELKAEIEELKNDPSK